MGRVATRGGEARTANRSGRKVALTKVLGIRERRKENQGRQVKAGRY